MKRFFIVLQMLPWNRAVYYTNFTASQPTAKRWLGINKRYATFQQAYDVGITTQT